MYCFLHFVDDFFGLIGAATCPPFSIERVVGWNLKFVLFLKSWVKVSLCSASEKMAKYT